MPSSWLYTVDQVSYVHGVKTLLVTPAVSLHTPVCMVVHEGLETLVCPTMVDAEVTLCCISAWKFGVPAGSARIAARFVPSVPINKKFASGAIESRARTCA
ncbi:hypothetical protein LAUMK136_01164 [Mycobacterium attenuatum]|uniref:Uncharacterized protein n=1 Tax=Mycobacterium attenuatum TaxID=2341086 RepID=A0A498PQK0_9MYCO|nr:hypothetical protein LAUMK136_01164 [Mycobacterium attenuatum]